MKDTADWCITKHKSNKQIYRNTKKEDPPKTFRIKTSNKYEIPNNVPPPPPHSPKPDNPHQSPHIGTYPLETLTPRDPSPQKAVDSAGTSGRLSGGFQAPQPQHLLAYPRRPRDPPGQGSLERYGREQFFRSQILEA